MEENGDYVSKTADINEDLCAGLTPELSREEFSRLNKSYEFHLDFGLKVVAFFYAALGGVLSIYFSGTSKLNNATYMLLGIPLVISFILGAFFIVGAKLWGGQAKYLRRLARKLKIKRPPEVMLLRTLLYAFGILFILTGFGLFWLLVTVQINA
jgi:hypothetical protein